MSSENLKNHIDVKNILIDMGIYFQVQVNSCLIDAILCSKNFMSDAVLVKHVLTNFFWSYLLEGMGSKEVKVLYSFCLFYSLLMMGKGLFEYK